LEGKLIISIQQLYHKYLNAQVRIWFSKHLSWNTGSNVG